MVIISLLALSQDLSQCNGDLTDQNEEFMGFKRILWDFMGFYEILWDFRGFYEDFMIFYRVL